jgi:hypothetical protein
MALQQKLLAAAGVENILECPNYSGLVVEDTDSSTMWQEVLSAVQVNHSVSLHIIHTFNTLNFSSLFFCVGLATCLPICLLLPKAPPEFPPLVFLPSA